MDTYLTEVSTRFARRRFCRLRGPGDCWTWANGSRAVAAVEDAASQSSMDGDVDAFIHARMASAYVPGLSLAIIHDGKLQRTMAFGFSNLGQDRPMRSLTCMRIHSLGIR